MTTPSTPRHDPTTSSGCAGAQSREIVVGATAGLPPRARPPLAVCAAAALIGGLALFAATRREFGESGLLLLLGWTGVAVAAVAALVFAARSGRLDGAEPAEQPRTVAQHRGAEPWDRAAD